MCLGIPGEVVEIRDDAGLRYGKVRFAGVSREVCLECVPQAKVGDFVLVHVGLAIACIDADEAARTYAVLRELGAAEEGLDDEPDEPDETDETGEEGAA